MQKLSNMKISKKVIIPMIILLVTVLLNGIGGIINLKVVMDLGNEINNVHFTNVYNLEQLNSYFERMQKLVYTHCVTDIREHRLEIENAIDGIYNETDALMTTISNNLPEGELSEMFQEFPNKYNEFTTVFTEPIAVASSDTISQSFKASSL